MGLKIVIGKARSRKWGSESGRKTYQMEHIGGRVSPSRVEHLNEQTLTCATALKIKGDLIKKAKIKKDYAKLKRNANNLDENQDRRPRPATKDEVYDEHDTGVETTTSPHPDRQAMMDSSPVPETTTKSDPRSGEPSGQQRKPKHQPFQAQYTAVQKRKEEAEIRRKEREEAEQQRQLKLEERERFRKAMAKARTGGKNGQRKLGRESKVLLERVKRMTAAD